jgi:uncharacterized Ntn-hydrolase superfamily protein
MNTIMDAAAHAVAEAEHEQVKAAAALLAEQETCAGIEARLAAIESDRAAIVGRRAGGDRRPDDAARLALLDADREGLRALLAEADAAVAAARGPSEQAERVLAAARFQLARCQDAAVEAAVLDHVRALDTAMLNAIAELEAVATRMGRTGRPAWSASSALYLKLRTLAAARGEL